MIRLLNGLAREHRLRFPFFFFFGGVHLAFSFSFVGAVTSPFFFGVNSAFALVLAGGLTP